MFRRNRYAYRDEAVADGAAGAGAGAATSAPADGAAPAGAATGAAASVLAAGAAAVTPGATDYIPEKFRTNNAEGAFDLEASSRAMAESYSAMEKRLGTGDTPPKTASEYKVTVPEAFKEAIDPATDTGVQGFLTGALAEGMTQKQVDFVMGQYFQMAPQLAAGAAQFDANTATAELKKTWATDADFTRNVRNAYVGANAAAQKAGLDINTVMAGPLGNSPDFLRLMAALGPEFQEDAGIGGATMTSQEDISSLMNSEAYKDPRHVDHAKVTKKIQTYYVRKYGTEAAA